MILTSYGMQASSPGPGPGQYFAFVTGNGGTVESLGCTKNASALLKSANFLVIPSGYGPARIYPETPLNFNGYFPFVRASTATYTGQNGLIQRTGSSYNLYTYSEEFDNAVWARASITATANQILAPDGSMTGDRVRISSPSGQIRVRRTITATGSPGDQFVYSTYVSRGSTGETGCSYIIGNSASSSFSSGTFDLIAKTFATGTTGSWLTGRSYESAPNGWTRLIFTATIPAGESTLLTSVTPGLLLTSTSAELGKFNFIWGSQLTSGSEVLPYQYVKESRLSLPRLDYSLGACPTILLEPARTNLCTASEDFSAAYYNYGVPATGSILVSTNQIVAPDGTLTADKLSPGTNTGDHQFRCSANGFATATSISVFGKAGELKNLRLGSSASAGNRIDFDLSNGTLSGIRGIGTTGFIKNYGNGWYRCELTATIGSVCDSYILDNSGDQTFTGNGTDGLYLWGYQFESRGATGSSCEFSTSYIPTSGVSVARAAEVLQLTNAVSAGFVGASGGTWYVEFKNNISYAARDAAGFFGIGDTSALTTNSLVFLASISGRQVLRKYVAGASSVLFSTTTDNVKLVVKWNGSTADVFVNTVKVVSATPFTTTIMEFFTGNSADFPKYIQAMALFNEPKSDQFCIDITT